MQFVLYAVFLKIVFFWLLIDIKQILKIKTKGLYILLFVFLSFFSFSQERTRLLITCSDCGKNNKILYSGNIDSVFIQREVKKSLLRLNLEGFINASAGEVSKSNFTYSVDVIAGERYSWSKISVVSSEGSLPSKLSDIASLENKSFSVEDLKNAIEETIIYFENNGYPFVSAQVENLSGDQKGISAEIKITKNEYYSFDSLILKGNAKISPLFLSLYCDLKKGDPYNEKTVLNLSSRIDELLFLKETKPVEIIFKDGKAKVLTFLDNAKANQVSGIIGFLPDNRVAGKLLLTGEANLFLINSFQQGETISFIWQKPENKSQNLDLKFIYPFIYKFPVGVNYRLNLLKKDTTYLTVCSNYGLRLKMKGKNYISLFYKSESSSIISTGHLENITALPSVLDYNSGITGVTFYSDNLDYFYNPLKGYQIEITAGTGKKNIRKNSAIPVELYDNLDLKTNKTEADINASLYIPLAKKASFRLRTLAGKKFNNQLFENEIYRLGGLKTLRGFDEESVYASGFVVFSGELKYVFEKNSAFYIFSDVAQLEKITIDEDFTDNPLSFGIGADFETKAGIFTINYAVGREQGNPFILRNAKIHFGYVNRF
ncbi:MAG: hypothetical protein A2W91_11950 [Bacteroidetes bacterium GWF2_38_335]|nr:MAG: hypothetical protein A2W91_11950 [Bacteroidetes bacterium GWF2_38_335]OFY76886.1 MAG: hypothetical protein A2281_00065 [Bacteroidetes bacterium RIFOXYA12_FULL_38_20]